MTRCVFDEAWIGQCKGEAVKGLDPAVCESHASKKCWCGAQAVRSCEVASSFVCGQPLCVEHDCHSLGGIFTGSLPHSNKGRQQYEEWKVSR